MPEISKNDRNLLGLLQKQGALSVSELADRMEVTETAIRQRLTRLIAQGMISRDEQKISRGRPVHKYSVTKAGRQSSGQNFSDLASVVWDEVREIQDSEIRSQVIRGIAKRLASKYLEEMRSMPEFEGDSISTVEKAKSIARFFESRGIPVTVDQSQMLSSKSGASESNPSNADELSSESGSDSSIDNREPFPILQLHGCPYPGLSERDELICEMEQSMFSELAGCDVELHRCDRSAGCCTFQLDAEKATSGEESRDDGVPKRKANAGETVTANPT